MNKEYEMQINTSVTGQLNEIELKEYILAIEINYDWVSYRHPDYALNSASLQEGRFNLSGTAAYYLASGDYCGQFEVPQYYERIPCSIKPHTIYAFDLPAFARAYSYDKAFVEQREDGGWAVCQALSQFLTTNHAVTGVLYQSAASHKHGQNGYCLAILPGEDQSLPDDFFSRKNGDKTVRSTGDPKA